jgi:hypothetical protein
VTGLEPREVRFVRTDDDRLLALGLDAAARSRKPTRASEIESGPPRRPDIADVIVHTEP